MNTNKRSNENSGDNNMSQNKRQRNSKYSTASDELNEIVKLLELTNPELITTAVNSVAQDEGLLDAVPSIDLVSPECVAAGASVDSLVQVYAFHDDSHGDDICSQVEIPTEASKPVILQNVIIATPSSEVATVSPEAIASTSSGVSAVAERTRLACMPVVDTMRVAMHDALTACQNESAALESRAIVIKKRKEEIRRELKRVCREEVVNNNKLKKVDNFINNIVVHLNSLGGQT